MDRIKGWIGFAVIAGLIGLTAITVLASRSRHGAEPGQGSVAGDVVLAENLDLRSTATKAERRRIRELAGSVRDAVGLAGLTIDYPLDETIVPPDLVPPKVLWHDEATQADRWLIEIELARGASRLFVLVSGDEPEEPVIDPKVISEANEIYEPTPYQASARAWRPSAEIWDAIRERSVELPATVTVLGYRGDDPARVVSRGTTTLTTSSDPVGAPIFYRDVPLMPSSTKEGVIKPLAKGALPLINWRLKDVSRTDSRVLLADMPTCANCHSFSADGKTLGMDIDGPQGDKGAYAIAPITERMEIRDEQVITWNKFADKPPGFITLGFLSRLSPDGQFAMTTVNEAIYVQNFRNYRFSQVFYPTRGILAYYSRATGEIRALPGADDPSYVHCDPVWTPDGKTIVFARARARDPYDRSRQVAAYAGDPNETPIQYDLYRIPFDDGRGGRPEPIAGASGNDTSNTFPKVSPDGKWIVFVKCHNGQLMRPDSKLWIVPVAGGEARPMRCNTSLMNSWHSFSPNGRWMVFSSKSNTPYTQMFLTHIDEEGNDSPAVLIENSTAANRAVNIPEFVNVPYDEFLGISVPAVSHYRYFERGNQLAREGRHEEAAAEFDKALAGDWKEWRTNDWRIHDSMSKVLLQLGEHEQALEHIRESLRLNPYNVEMHGNMGLILFETGIFDEALKHMDIAVQLFPKDAQAWYNRATLHLRLGNHAGALADYTEAIRLRPDYAAAHDGRGIALRETGDLRGAAEDFDAAIRLDPRLPTAWYGRAMVRRETGDLAGAVEDLTEALRVAPSGWPHSSDVEALRSRIRARIDGQR